MNNYLKFEKKIYQVFGLKLGRPLRVKAVLYFFMFGIGTLIFYNLPIIGNLISWMPKSVLVLIPIGLAWLLADVGTENRSPIHFFRSFIGYHYRTLYKRHTFYRGRTIPKENVYEFRNYMTFRIPEEELVISPVIQPIVEEASVPVGELNTIAKPETVEKTKQESVEKQKRIAAKWGRFRWKRNEKVSGSPQVEVQTAAILHKREAGQIGAGDESVELPVAVDMKKVDTYEEQIAVTVQPELSEGVIHEEVQEASISVESKKADEQDDFYVAAVKEAEEIFEQAARVEAEKPVEVESHKKPVINLLRSFYENRKKETEEVKAVSEVVEPVQENASDAVNVQDSELGPTDENKVVVFSGKQKAKKEIPVVDSVLSNLKSIDTVIPTASKQNEQRKKQEEVFQLLSLDIEVTDQEKKQKKKKWMVF